MGVATHIHIYIHQKANNGNRNTFAIAGKEAMMVASLL